MITSRPDHLQAGQAATPFTVTTTAGTLGTTTKLTISGLSGGSPHLPAGISFTIGQRYGHPRRHTDQRWRLYLRHHGQQRSRLQPDLHLTVNQAPFTSASSTVFMLNQLASFHVTTSGFSTAATTLTPTGTTARRHLTDNGSGTGTSAVRRPWRSVFPITFTVDNGVGIPVQQPFTLNVDVPPTFNSANQATFVVGQVRQFHGEDAPGPHDDDLDGKRLPAAGYSAAGLTFVDNRNGTATISGTPAPAANGVFSFVLIASNAVG